MTEKEPSQSRRLPRALEREFAKLLGTLGFRAYASALWNLSASTASGQTQMQGDAIPAMVLSQIIEQSCHDPAVLSAGTRVLPFLARRVSSALDQHRIDVATLFNKLTERVEVVIVTPRLIDVTTGQLAAAFGALQSAGARSFAIVLTEEGGEDDAHADARDSFERISGVHVVFWRDHNASYNANNSRLFSLFLHALGPAIVLISESRLGIETVARYGRALMRVHRLFCMFPIGASTNEPPPLARYLRAVSSHATIFTDSQAAVSTLLTYGADPDGPGVVALEPLTITGADGFARSLVRITGTAFRDGRASPALSSLLAGRDWRSAASPVTSTLEPASSPNSFEFDITVTIVFHREGRLAVPALASLADLIRTARHGGLTIDAQALLDRPDEKTRQIVSRHGAGIVTIQEVDFGDPSLTRNAGIERARGRFLAFLDGDDLWGANWLLFAHQAATAEGAPDEAIWHPEDVYLFYEQDFDLWTANEQPHPETQSTHFKHRSTLDADFDPRDALLENPWSANCLAPTETFRRFRYRSTEWEWQCGIEDWRWNLETLGCGIPHLVVGDTVHIIRIKDSGSLSAQHNLRGLMPILT